MVNEGEKHSNILNGSDRKSVISYVHVFCIPSERAWSIEVEKAWVCMCVLPE
jgi:hypothetical protein